VEKKDCLLASAASVEMCGQTNKYKGRVCDLAVGRLVPRRISL